MRLYFLPVLFILSSFLITVCRPKTGKNVFAKKTKVSFSPHEQKLIDQFIGDKNLIIDLLHRVHSAEKRAKEAEEYTGKAIFDCAANHVKNNLQEGFQMMGKLNREVKPKPELPEDLEYTIEIFGKLQQRDFSQIETKDSASVRIPQFFHSMYGFLTDPPAPVSKTSKGKKQNLNSKRSTKILNENSVDVEDRINCVKNEIEQHFGRKLDEKLKVSVAAEIARLKHGANFYVHSYLQKIENNPVSAPLEDILLQTGLSHAWNITDDGVAVLNIIRECVLKLPDRPIRVIHSKTLDGKPVPLLNINKRMCHKTNMHNTDHFDRFDDRD